MTDLHALVAQMTLAEKAALCTGASAWTTTPVPRLGIPEMVVADGPHGLRRVPDVHAIGAASLPATCFPTASSMACTWDVDLIRMIGQALGEEAIAVNVDVVLGPGANMKRTPLCGRNFEYYSEDPFLAGELAASYIEGVQSKGVGTSLKHFAANNQEFERFLIDTVVDERTLREIYLPAFETAVKKARPWTVMCAYNKLNGTYCSENHELLVDILKDEWGLTASWCPTGAPCTTASLRCGRPGPRDAGAPRAPCQAVIEAVSVASGRSAARRRSRAFWIVFQAAQTPKGGF